MSTLGIFLSFGCLELSRLDHTLLLAFSFGSSLAVHYFLVGLGLLFFGFGACSWEVLLNFLCTAYLFGVHELNMAAH